MEMLREENKAQSSERMASKHWFSSTRRGMRKLLTANMIVQAGGLDVAVGPAQVTARGGFGYEELHRSA